MEVDGAQKLCQKYFFRRDAAGRVPTGKHNVVTFDTVPALRSTAGVAMRARVARVSY